MPVTKLSLQFLYSHDFCKARYHIELNKMNFHLEDADIRFPRNGVLISIILKIHDQIIPIRLHHPFVVVNSCIYDRGLKT